jgi:hypothetical protein
MWFVRINRLAFTAFVLTSLLGSVTACSPGPSTQTPSVEAAPNVEPGQLVPKYNRQGGG